MKLADLHVKGGLYRLVTLPDTNQEAQIRKPSEKDTGLPPPSIFGRCYLSFTEGASIFVSIMFVHYKVC